MLLCNTIENQSMTKLTGKTIWITGASSGIGEALTYQLAARGNIVIISARREEELNRVKENCPEVSRDDIHVIPLDLSDLSSLDNTAQKALQIHGRVDVLFNNGGISQRSKVLDTSFEVDRRIMDVNFMSAVKLSKLVLPSMIKNGGGHIVATSSVVGKIGSPFRSAYAASKHALHGYFDSLRAELGKEHIGVTLFCGGYIKTNISLNAVLGDGSPQNKMDQNQARGKSANDAAKFMIRAVEANKSEVYFGGKEIMGIYLKRFIPGVLERILSNMTIKTTKIK